MFWPLFDKTQTHKYGERLFGEKDLSPLRGLARQRVAAQPTPDEKALLSIDSQRWRLGPPFC